jgi:hypothetical protein
VQKVRSAMHFKPLDSVRVRPTRRYVHIYIHTYVYVCAYILTSAHALQKASLSDSLADPNGAITVLAPNNEAFEATLAALGEDASAELLSDPEAIAEVSASTPDRLIDSHVSVCMCDVNVLQFHLQIAKSGTGLGFVQSLCCKFGSPTPDRPAECLTSCMNCGTSRPQHPGARMIPAVVQQAHVSCQGVLKLPTPGADGFHTLRSVRDRRRWSICGHISCTLLVVKTKIGGYQKHFMLPIQIIAVGLTRGLLQQLCSHRAQHIASRITQTG